MKAQAILGNAENIAILAGLGIAGFLLWKAYTTAKSVSGVADSIANKASQIYTSATTAAGNAVTKTEVALKQLSNPDAFVTIASPVGASPEVIRRDAVNLLEGLRTAKAVSDTLPQNAPFTLWRDFKDWATADTTGKAVRDSFYSRNPEGVFYD